MTQKERISDFVRDLLDNELPADQCSIILGMNERVTNGINGNTCENHEAEACKINSEKCVNVFVCGDSTNGSGCTSYQKPNYNTMGSACLKG